MIGSLKARIPSIHQCDDIYSSEFLGGLNKMRKVLDKGSSQAPPFSPFPPGLILPQDGMQRNLSSEGRAPAPPSPGWSARTWAAGKKMRCGCACAKLSGVSCPREMETARLFPPPHQWVICFLGWDSVVTTAGHKPMKIERSCVSVPSVPAKTLEGPGRLLPM